MKKSTKLIFPVVALGSLAAAGAAGYGIYASGMLQNLLNSSSNQYFAPTIKNVTDDIAIRKEYKSPFFYKEDAEQYNALMSKLVTDYDLETLQIDPSKSKKEIVENYYKSADKFVKDAKNIDNQVYREYVDPVTKIKFVDFAYYEDEITETNEDGSITTYKIPRYLLGEEGLKLLATEFKRKIPFGPEVFALKEININNFFVSPPKTKGLYIQELQHIYLNGASLAEKGLDLFSIVKYMTTTLFHEYMHHWATFYAETGKKSDQNTDLNNKDIKTQQLLYYKDSSVSSLASGHKHSLTQYWNGYFSSNFKKLLNYDVDKKALYNNPIKTTLRVSPDLAENTLFTTLSLNEIWRLANEANTADITNKFTTVDDTQLIYGVNQSDTNKPEIKFEIGLNTIQYYFSLTELVPREYTKYAFESYFDINDDNNAQKRDFYLKNNGSYVSWSGLYFTNLENRKTYNYLPSANVEDWWKTFYIKPSSQILKASKQRPAYLAYPNNIFDASKFIDRNGNALEKERTKNRSEEFYQLFLNTMGYGKEIAQIFSDNKWKWGDSLNENHKYHTSIESEDAYTQDIKFIGYMPSKEYTGFAIIKSSGDIEVTPFEYQDTFSFFGKSKIDTGASLWDPATRNDQIRSRIYPKEKYYPYVTKDFIKLENNSVIALWKDLNQNGIYDAGDEIVHRELSIPTQRWVSTEKSSITSQDLEKNSNTYKITVTNVDSQTKIQVRK
ncbi:hypothetical protein VO56_01985 [Mycoplasmopsis gallinacea]|uniref:Uncharacterized protein n=1 Tax=Mycoplasmopsis gallinacea TaxID=29556 RepID=A0A0D5ZK10_9BACT|nr:hypothetical protein VO56_01985 [Mycoplasmopsis gallinacea]